MAWSDGLVVLRDFIDTRCEPNPTTPRPVPGLARRSPAVYFSARSQLRPCPCLVSPQPDEGRCLCRAQLQNRSPPRRGRGCSSSIDRTKAQDEPSSACLRMSCNSDGITTRSTSIASMSASALISLCGSGSMRLRPCSSLPTERSGPGSPVQNGARTFMNNSSHGCDERPAPRAPRPTRGARRLGLQSRPRAHSSAGERSLHTREVPGSIPGAPITTRPVVTRRPSVRA